jgi:flavin reductase (DIM6/NTAB) family NADH-FMN oxidoreductase RutF
MDQNVDPQRFKEGMRRLGASVCLITTRRPDGERFGLTATAVCSLSAAPPTLLCCLNTSSRSFEAVSSAGVFCVNVLSEADAGVAHHFASGDRPVAEKFQAGRWREGPTGAPMLETAIAAFDCTLEQAVEVGTHAIMIGRVGEIGLGASAQPLLYVQGGYGRFTAADAEATLAAG